MWQDKKQTDDNVMGSKQQEIYLAHYTPSFKVIIEHGNKKSENKKSLLLAAMPEDLITLCILTVFRPSASKA